MILILDFGSQYTQLIARRVRELGVYSEILPYNAGLAKIKARSPKGVILSGGPSSVCDENAPTIDKKIFSLKVPILGICYGMQLMAKLLGGGVLSALNRGYGKSEVAIERDSPLFSDIPREFDAWVSHGDHVETLPDGFIKLASSPDSPVAAMEHPARRFYGMQFHPEVVHTMFGNEILFNFLTYICDEQKSWNTVSFIDAQIANIRELVGKDRVLCGLSGGVDSSVTAALISRAVKEQLTCVFVDTGLLRYREGDLVQQTFKRSFDINFIRVDAEERFFSALKGVVEPEQKRRIIGETFIRIFEEEAKKAGEFKYLAQGTLYPDVIESLSVNGPSATIKSHHNVGGLPKDMKFTLLEPLRELFKDEVRLVGQKLGLADDIVMRHPFPGPGLAIRILGEVTKARCDTLRKADYIALEELKNSGQYNNVWQAFCVLLPVSSVGVAGDDRTYENVAAFRAVTARDGMTADWAKLDYNLLATISSRIINEVKGINRLVYDISSKPPATIEWE
ncbi:MAG: glutamine-hydrolyzing GMP synthase [Deferribacteraceae bacterium]|jgi:GMP synthase (glutamine-hydrolysing)|nr:glutamine-hydrolyzing GMP synthase [Deferribacteraceae bacterium]